MKTKLSIKQRQKEKRTIRQTDKQTQRKRWIDNQTHRDGNEKNVHLKEKDD